ncbi:hypothetical protein, partial [Bilophila sp.]|uniref:hypothetical protein n=1 Tax=Bilophila sp. TaxID=1929485 RepID=UPI003077D54F
MEAHERLHVIRVCRRPPVVIAPFPAAVAVADEPDGLAAPDPGEREHVSGDVPSFKVVRKNKTILSLSGNSSIGQSSHW